MFLTKVKVTTAVAALVCLLGLGTVAVSHRAEATPAPGHLGGAPADRDGEKATPRAKKRDWVLVPARQQGVVEVIGREPRPGEKVPADRLITVGKGGKQKQYVRLVEGDSIRKGELLARIDDAVARVNVDIKVAKVEASEADRRASSKTKDEAQKRYEALREGVRRPPASVADEEIRGAKLTWERYIEDDMVKKHATNIARQELQQAKILLAMYEIRSPVDGVIVDILIKEGEAVRQFEGVFRVRIDSGKK
jgi:multidrug efflux pump subunit AcrA (membrane-fusion protein)